MTRRGDQRAPSIDSAQAVIRPAVTTSASAVYRHRMKSALAMIASSASFPHAGRFRADRLRNALLAIVRKSQDRYRDGRAACTLQACVQGDAYASESDAGPERRGHRRA